MILAAVGKNATGKDYFLEYISKKYNLPMYSIGDVARELACKEGIEATRENLHYISQKYMSRYGQTFFPEQIAKKIIDNNMKNVLVSGIRPATDVYTLKRIFKDKFILVDVVVSDDSVRFERMKKRGSSRDPLTFEKMLEYDANEERLFETSKTEAMADFVIYNDGSPEDFHREIDNFYNKYLKV